MKQWSRNIEIILIAYTLSLSIHTHTHTHMYTHTHTHTHTHIYIKGFLVAQMVKNLPATQETWVWSLVRTTPLFNPCLTRGHSLQECFRLNLERSWPAGKPEGDVDSQVWPAAASFLQVVNLPIRHGPSLHVSLCLGENLCWLQVPCRTEGMLVNMTVRDPLSWRALLTGTSISGTLSPRVKAVTGMGLSHLHVTVSIEDTDAEDHWSVGKVNGPPSFWTLHCKNHKSQSSERIKWGFLF